MKKYFLNFMMAAVTVAGLATSACTTNLCKDVDCVNGDCDGTDGSCVCTTGYETATDGKCTVVSRDKFIADYNVVETGTSTDPVYNGTFNYTVKVISSSTGIDKVIIQKFGALTCSNVDLEVTGTVSEKNKITFNTSSCSDITVTGSGTIGTDGKITATWTGSAPAGGVGPVASTFSSTGIFTKK